MAETVAAYLAEYVGEWLAASTVTAVEVALTVAEIAASVYVLRDQQRRAEQRARDAYNASLRDRYVMVRSASEPRAIVLGRCRVSGPMAFVKSYGDKDQNLVFVLPIAAHEIDGVEKVFFGDDELLLNSAGYVAGVMRRADFTIQAATGTFTLPEDASSIESATATYGSTVVNLAWSQLSSTQVSVSGATVGQTGKLSINYRPSSNPYGVTGQNQSKVDYFTTVTGSDTFTLSAPPLAESVAVYYFGGTQDDRGTPLTVSVDGQNITLSGARENAMISVSYQTPVLGLDTFASGNSGGAAARVTWHLGAPGQTADGDIIAALPDYWTKSHVGNGLAYLTVWLAYSQDAFPQGIPNVSAVVRGAKVYDPRTQATAWSQNAALQMRYYALHPFGGRLTSAQIEDTSFIAAANVCDTSTNYVVNGHTYTRPLYQSAYVAKSGQRPADCLNDLAQAMGGKWTFVDGLLRVKAGAYTPPVLQIDEQWIHAGSAVQIQPSRPRSEMINVVTGLFADEEQDFQEVPFPRVPDQTSGAAWIAADGAELPLDLPLHAVTFVGQCQYIAACKLRDTRQGLTVRMSMNMRAYQLEVFDVVNVSLSRFGWVNKPFEVLETTFSIDGGFEVTLKETSTTIWQMDAGFQAADPAPNTLLPSPWGLPKVTGLSATASSTTQLTQADGSVLQRILVSWDAVADARIASGGWIDISWGDAGQPENTWTVVSVPGDSVQCFLTPVQVSVPYVIKARVRSALAVGDWCTQITYSVSQISSPDVPQVAISGNIPIAVVLVPNTIAAGQVLTGQRPGLPKNPSRNASL